MAQRRVPLTSRNATPVVVSDTLRRLGILERAFSNAVSGITAGQSGSSNGGIIVIGGGGGGGGTSRLIVTSSYASLPVTATVGDLAVVDPAISSTGVMQAFLYFWNGTRWERLTEPDIISANSDIDLFAIEPPELTFGWTADDAGLYMWDTTNHVWRYVSATVVAGDGVTVDETVADGTFTVSAALRTPIAGSPPNALRLTSRRLDVPISLDAGNSLSIHGDGLYAAAGSSAPTISPDTGNIAVNHANGLYVPTPPAAPVIPATSIVKLVAKTATNAAFSNRTDAFDAVSFTVPANSYQALDVFVLEAWGDVLNNTTGQQGFTFSVKIGTTTVLASGAQQLSNNSLRRRWHYRLVVMLDTLTGQSFNADWTVTNPAATLWNPLATASCILGGDESTVALTGTPAFALTHTVQMATASTLMEYLVKGAMLTQLR